MNSVTSWDLARYFKLSPAGVHLICKTWGIGHRRDHKQKRRFNASQVLDFYYARMIHNMPKKKLLKLFKQWENEGTKHSQKELREMKDTDLHKEFYEETKLPVSNKQGEPELDYVIWLEKKVLNSQRISVEDIIEGIPEIDLCYGPYEDDPVKVLEISKQNIIKLIMK